MNVNLRHPGQHGLVHCFSKIVLKVFYGVFVLLWMLYPVWFLWEHLLGEDHFAVVLWFP